ncbi:MAG: hypothetical protein COA43_00970 [Robiginitomaculum sp.]|nr:MAG: hypothetical protein COA43_00970 [Robiginitomaculum sp.]
MGTILIDTPAKHVCRIRIDRPKKLNALNYEIREAMLEALPDILNNSDNRAIVFGGVGGNLSAGGDVPSMQNLTKCQANDRMGHIHELCRLVAGANIPIVTAAEGICAGGAVGLSLLGDYIIVDSKTKIMVPFLKLGLVPDWGMMRSLPLRVGLPKARRMILENQTISGDRAIDIGLADIFASNNDVMGTAIMTAEKLTELPILAVGMVKDRLRRLVSFEEDLFEEQLDQIQGLTGMEFEEGFDAYMNKRRANFISVKSVKNREHSK